MCIRDSSSIDLILLKSKVFKNNLRIPRTEKIGFEVDLGALKVISLIMYIFANVKIR